MAGCDCRTSSVRFLWKILSSRSTQLFSWVRTNSKFSRLDSWWCFCCASRISANLAFMVLSCCRESWINPSTLSVIFFSVDRISFLRPSLTWFIFLFCLHQSQFPLSLSPKLLTSASSVPLLRMFSECLSWCVDYGWQHCTQCGKKELSILRSKIPAVDFRDIAVNSWLVRGSTLPHLELAIFYLNSVVTSFFSLTPVSRLSRVGWFSGQEF